MIVAITRLHLRSLRFLLPFAVHARRSRLQAERADGCLGVVTRKTRGLAFWTLTLWDSERHLKAYMLAGSHRIAMPKLAQWCDEAAVAQWAHDSAVLPSWDAAVRQLANHGRLSRVRYPSRLHSSGTIVVS